MNLSVCAHALLLAVAAPAAAQIGAATNAAETARVFHLDTKMEKLRALPAQPASLERLTARQDLLQSIQASYLEVDSVIAELTNEQSKLGSLMATLQNRRDKTMGRLTSAALITGSGLGAAVSATQFTTNASTIQNIGDGFGIGSGVASIVLSIMAARSHRGPNGAVDDSPNMLAPLLGGIPVLNTYYAPAVLLYLQSVPAGNDPTAGTRLERLLRAWDRAGRLPASDSVMRTQKITVLTSSGDPQVKSSINDLTDRIAMLGDVRVRVSLMKRDLASLMRSYTNR